jgi:hypothetical protein
MRWCCSRSEIPTSSLVCDHYATKASTADAAAPSLRPVPLYRPRQIYSTLLHRWRQANRRFLCAVIGGGKVRSLVFDPASERVARASDTLSAAPLQAAGNVRPAHFMWLLERYRHHVTSWRGV